MHLPVLLKFASENIWETHEDSNRKKQACNNNDDDDNNYNNNKCNNIKTEYGLTN